MLAALAAADVVDCNWKGPHFWDEAPYPRRRAKDPTKYDGSFQAYVAIFDKPAQLIALDPARRITGEASSNTFTAVLTYLRGPISAKQLGIPVTLAQYLWEAAPWSRFVSHTPSMLQQSDVHCEASDIVELTSLGHWGSRAAAQA